MTNTLTIHLIQQKTQKVGILAIKNITNKHLGAKQNE